MAKWRIGACPRCGGSLFIDKDEEWYEQCLNCGYRGELKVAGAEQLAAKKAIPRKWSHEEN